MPSRRPILADPATWSGLLYLLTGLPLGIAWFVALITAWSVVASLAITPLVIPLLIATALMTRGCAAVEAALARSLLGADAHAPGPAPRRIGFWARFRAMLGGGFWRAQAFLVARSLIGFPVAVAFVSLLATAIGLIFAPAWVPFLHDGAQLGFWRPHTFVQSLALIPAGLVLLPLTILATRPFAAAFRAWATGLLGAEGERADVARRAASRRRLLTGHAGTGAAIVLLLVVIWAATPSRYFWPEWALLPFATALAIHGWVVLIAARDDLVARAGGHRGLLISAGIGMIAALFLVVVWAITGAAYFWPAWPVGGIALALAVQALVVVRRPSRALAERIETLETSRAGAVDVQETELRRIERDLHDGAQARLVALGMHIGMAEQSLGGDPERVRELLAEARAGAETALRELRDLARGIHPPVLADRGLEAALRSLANSTPIEVALAVDVAERPAPAVETATYFVAAEAIANAAKHAHADHVEIRVARIGSLLTLDVTDDGGGGADPDGSGLRGLRRRVEALDGRLLVTSPAGGPTTIHAELPCA